jgi:hypothetical protein
MVFFKFNGLCSHSKLTCILLTSKQSDVELIGMCSDLRTFATLVCNILNLIKTWWTTKYWILRSSLSVSVTERTLSYSLRRGHLKAISIHSAHFESQSFFGPATAADRESTEIYRGRQRRHLVASWDWSPVSHLNVCLSTRFDQSVADEHRSSSHTNTHNHAFRVSANQLNFAKQEASATDVSPVWLRYKNLNRSSSFDLFTHSLALNVGCSLWPIRPKYSIDSAVSVKDGLNLIFIPSTQFISEREVQRHRWRTKKIRP